VAGCIQPLPVIRKRYGFKTLRGGNLTNNATKDRVYVNNAKIIITDIKTDNGVVDIIDSVLIPPG